MKFKKLALCSLVLSSVALTGCGAVSGTVGVVGDGLAVAGSTIGGVVAEGAKGVVSVGGAIASGAVSGVKKVGEVTVDVAESAIDTVKAGSEKVNAIVKNTSEAKNNLTTSKLQPLTQDSPLANFKLAGGDGKYEINTNKNFVLVKDTETQKTHLYSTGIRFVEESNGQIQRLYLTGYEYHGKGKVVIDTKNTSYFESNGLNTPMTVSLPQPLTASSVDYVAKFHESMKEAVSGKSDVKKDRKVAKKANKKAKFTKNGKGKKAKWKNAQPKQQSKNTIDWEAASKQDLNAKYIAVEAKGKEVAKEVAKTEVEAVKTEAKGIIETVVEKGKDAVEAVAETVKEAVK